MQTPDRNRTSAGPALSGYFRAVLVILILLSSVGTLQALEKNTPQLERLTVTVGDHPFRVWARRPPEPRGVTGIKPPVVARFFTQLGASSRQWIVLGGGDHAAFLEDSHGAFIAALVSFLGQTTSAHP